MDVIGTLAIAAFVMLVAGYVRSKFLKQGKGRMLGGKIIDTTTEEIVQKSFLLTTSIRAHVVESKNNEKLVGLEISGNSILGPSFKPIKLTKTEAEKLAKMLSETANKT